MLKLGAQSIPALYLGGEQVKKAYLGEIVVFDGGNASRLPEGYTEVEYIQSTGGAAIDTQQKPTQMLRMALDVETLEPPSETATKYILGSGYASSTSNKYWLFVQYQNTGIVAYMGNYGSRPTGVVVSADANPRRMNIIVDCSIKQVSVNGEAKTLTSNLFSTLMNNIHLLASSASTIAGNQVNANIYSCQMYTDSTLIRDFVPCVDPTGLVGLYDLVTGVFFDNQMNHGVFTAGPAV